MRHIAVTSVRRSSRTSRFERRCRWRAWRLRGGWWRSRWWRLRASNFIGYVLFDAKIEGLAALFSHCDGNLLWWGVAGGWFDACCGLAFGFLLGGAHDT